MGRSILESMDWAEDQSKKKRPPKRRSEPVREKIVRKFRRGQNPERWGGKKFCEKFYEWARSNGVDIRDELGQLDEARTTIHVKYVAEMNRALDELGRRGYRKEGLAEALQSLFQHWHSGAGRGFPHGGVSIFDLRRSLTVVMRREWEEKGEEKGVDEAWGTQARPLEDLFQE